MSEKRNATITSTSSNAGDTASVTTVRSRKQLVLDGVKSDNMIEQMTSDQRNCAQQAFSSFDSSGTGLIATSNLRQLLRTLGFNPTEEEVQHVINEYEVDGVSEIDFPEFLFILAPMMVKDDLEVELSEMVRAFDPGRVGAVEAMEIRSVLEQLSGMHSMTPDEIDKMLAFIDRNHDGLLSVNELKRAVEIYQQ